MSLFTLSVSLPECANYYQLSHDKIRVRDSVEQDVSRFADFGRLYSHVAVGSCSRQGVLELCEDQGWMVYWCVLDDSTHSFSYYSVHDSGPPATRDTLLLRALSGAAVIPFNTACDAHAHELQQTLAAQSAPPKLRPFQFRLEVGEKVGTLYWL